MRSGRRGLVSGVTRVAGQAWCRRGVVAAAVVERIPLALQEPPQWAQEYQAFAEPIREQHKQAVFEEFANPEAFQQAPTSNEATLASFEPASIATENDTLDGIHSINRRLDMIVFLLRKHNDGSWGFPRTKVDISSGETVRTAAERALSESFNAGESSELELETYTIGNAPACHLEHESSGEDATFYVRIAHVDGDPESAGSQRAWIAKDELHLFLGERENDLMQRAL